MESLILNSNSIARVAAVQTLYTLNIDRSLGVVESADILSDIEFLYTKSDFRNRILYSGIDKIEGGNYYVKLRVVKLLIGIVDYAIRNMDDVDMSITQCLLEQTSFDSLSRTTIAILRAAISELFIEETSNAIIISDFLAVADCLACDKKEVGIINVVLEKCGKYAKKKGNFKE